MTNTLPVKVVLAKKVAKYFVDNWVFNYSPPTDLIDENRKQLLSKFFLEVCRFFNFHYSFTKTYNPQTNGQVEIFNPTILTPLPPSIGDHPGDWDIYKSAVTYAYNTQHQKSTSVAPFDLVQSKTPGPIAAYLPPTEYKDYLDFKQKWKKCLPKMTPEAQEKLQKAQERYKRNIEEKLRKNTKTNKPGDIVFLRIEVKDDKEKRRKLTPIS